MSQAARHTTEAPAEHHPSLTFLGPATSLSHNRHMQDTDVLDATADVVAFLNEALTQPREVDFTERANCGLSAILRAVEHTVRQAGMLVSHLERRTPDPAALKQQEMRAFVNGYKTRQAEEAAEAGTSPEGESVLVTYPRLDGLEGQDGEGVISDVPDDTGERGAARS